MYHSLPANIQTIFGSGVAMSALVAVLLNLLFNHCSNKGQGGSTPKPDEPSQTRPANYRI
jgi:xanthine/uracil permease